MRADTLTIRNIFQGDTLLRVPYFQRKYVWGAEDWKRFAMDMEGTMESLQKYFLGAIILKEEDTTIQDKRNGVGRRYLIIDGQQRLTTLSIYMKVLHMLTNKSDDFARQFLLDTDSQTPVLTHNWEDLPAYSKVMHLDTPQELGKDNKIFEAYDFFRGHLLESKERGVSLRDLLTAVNASVTFVAISLDYRDDEQQIFDTINSLGAPLTTGELMKNFLYQADDEDKYNHNWKPVFDVDPVSRFWDMDRAKSRQEKGSKTSNIEIFFHTFVRIKMWDFKDRLSIAQRKGFVKTSNVFSTCKAFVELFGMDRQELADEIIVYAKLFRENFDMDVLDEYIPSYSGIKRISCLVNATKSYVVIPYILYVLKNVSDESERNRIFGYVETYLIRRMLADSNSKSYSEFFSESLIANRLLTFDALKGFIESKDEDSNLAMPGDSKVEYGIVHREKGLEESTVRILYYMYESKVRTSLDERIQGFSEYQAEVLMPKPTNGNAANWPCMNSREREEERGRLIGSLGNCFIMNNAGKKELKKVKDEVFDIKIAVFQNYGEGIRCNTILKNMFQWTADDINSRNLALSKGFCKVFSI